MGDHSKATSIFSGPSTNRVVTDERIYFDTLCEFLRSVARDIRAGNASVCVGPAITLADEIERHCLGD